jgi:4-hydroxybenzoate polyprenyltransferase
VTTQEGPSPRRSATVEATVALEPDVHAAIALAPALDRPRGTAAAVLVTLRPRQWIKNALVVAAAGAAGALGRDDVPVRVSLACIAFCLLASGVYAINDVLDASEDRLHPRKRQAELRRTVGTGAGRRVLGHYSDGLLRLIAVGSAALGLAAYCGWAFLVPAVHGVPWRPLTLLPVAVALVRYGSLVRAGRGEAPEDVVFGDRVLAPAGLVWLVLFALGVHAAG